MNSRRLISIAVALSAACSAGAGTTLRLLSSVELHGAEIPAWESGTSRLWATCDQGLAALELAPDGAISLRAVHPAAAGAHFPPGVRAMVTHCAFDPAGRGVVAMCCAPLNAPDVPGAVVFMSTETGLVLGRLTVGFHPDAAAFTPDGAALLVANEGESFLTPRGRIINQPGSISVIRLDGVHGAPGFVLLDQSDVDHVPFTGPALDRALAEADAERLRIHPASRTNPAFDLEPESIAIFGPRAFVTLQESNAIAEIDIPSATLLRIQGLGAPQRLLDGNDTNGAPGPFAPFRAMPMPDQIGAVMAGVRVVLVTADEGDSRGDVGQAHAQLADAERLSTLAAAGALAPGAVEPALLSDDRLGRLKVCPFSGPSDASGRLTAPAALGARSVTVWDAVTLERLGDTGSEIESLIAREAPELFNASLKDDSLVVDDRSAARGPEPEGVAVANIDWRPVAFITLERPGIILSIDLTDPANPRIDSMTPAARDGLCGPEGIAFIDARRHPTGRALLAVAFETSGHVAVYEVVTDAE